ncbi:MAG: AEC family transporter [Clostridia bacterium]|nr:AEC family transporter [Clostridia bacterium]MBQ3483776.1 AEC family transporter [Clostridia bacterium]
MLNDLLFSANVIVPIFLLIMLGYALTRLKVWDAHFLKIANDVCFKALLPVLLFYNVASANIFEVFDGKLIVYACLCACALCGLLFLIVPLFVKDKKRRGVMIQGTFRSNFLLFGVPLGLSIGGAAGSVLAAVVASFYVPVINMLSVISLYVFSDAENKSLKSALLGIVKNPLVIGGVSGLVFSFIRNSIGFEILTMLDTTLFNIKSIATPLAFLILGGDLKFGSMLRNVKYSAFSVLGKTVLIPAVMLPISALLGFDSLEMAILLAVFATPNAVSSYAMARNYEEDYELAGEIITLGTLISIFTIFVFITVTKYLGWI